MFVDLYLPDFKGVILMIEWILYFYTSASGLPIIIKNIYSEKTGKTFDADLLLDDNGERTVYRFDFGRERTT